MSEENDESPCHGLSEGEVERRDHLISMRDSGAYLTKEEKQELEGLLARDKEEYDRRALIHSLSSVADTYGRKAVANIKRDVTSQVKRHNSAEKSELTMLNLRYAKVRSDLDSKQRQEMHKIQEQHNLELKAARASQDADVAEVRAKFKEGYDKLNVDLESRTSTVSAEVAAFVSAIKNLDLEDLKVLQTDGVWQTEGENARPITVPGTTTKSA